MISNFLIYSSPIGWGEALQNPKFKRRSENRGGYAPPDFLLFGKSELNEIYDVLKINPDLKYFLGELSVSEVENKRAINVISTAFHHDRLNLNLKDFGFHINRKLELFYGVRKSEKSKIIVDNFGFILKGIIEELRVNQSRVVNLASQKDLFDILSSFGYEKEAKKREIGFDHAMDIIPLKIYEILLSSFIASCEM